MAEKPWFSANPNGISWGCGMPCSSEGWFVTVGFGVFLGIASWIYAASLPDDGSLPVTSTIIFVAVAVLLSAVMLAIISRTKERPSPH